MTVRVASPPPERAARGGTGRADSRRNRARLLAAAGEELQRGRQFTLADVAERARLSTATAYRHFSSAEEVVAAYVGGFWDDVDARARAIAADDFPAFCRAWVDAVLEWGPALVYLRSRDGFLARRAAADPRVGRLLAVVEPRIQAELRAAGTSCSSELSYVLAVWNALADPREVLDQRQALGWSGAHLSDNLCRTVRAAIRR
jgi:AcrR family transcriptional regulator